MQHMTEELLQKADAVKTKIASNTLTAEDRKVMQDNWDFSVANEPIAGTIQTYLNSDASDDEKLVFLKGSIATLLSMKQQMYRELLMLKTIVRAAFPQRSDTNEELAG